MSLKNVINKDNIPCHIAIIMDGNGRWAIKRGNSRILGHKAGAISVRKVVEASLEIGVKYLTLYTFSTENWERPKIEITAIMALLEATINSEIEDLKKNNVKLLTIGDSAPLPINVMEKINYAINATSENTGLTLILALSYGAKQDIANAMRLIGKDVEKGIFSISNISIDTFGKYLSTANLPDPELLIRTGGEYRISNFLLWEIAYSELYFTETLWPDFDKEDFYKAILNYQKRERRYGKTSNQLTKMKNII
ncbi:MAG: di-trans,poly-cis-decaprenylcistransferase [Bacteroidetes bacterium GWF2_40_14]|nr:MAG: di-trans,poly-cis-decaprenylcistransferase [Bacteroidetes bacterium GWF2_40_14]